MTEPLKKQHGDFLLKLARLAIENNFRDKKIYPPPLDQDLLVESGTFVTLKIKGSLRGCIGNLTPARSIYDGVKENAVNAAFNDHRFTGLSQKELTQIRIGISVLTSPQPVVYSTPEELKTRLRPGIDGVILRLGGSGATFLPQVWQQLPEVEVFLSHLCRKAGLSETAWRDSHPDIEIYQVQEFEEEEV